MNIINVNTYNDIICEYILKNINLEKLDYDIEIFENGLVNSLFAIELMTFLEKTFGIKIRFDDLDMNNFKSVNCIADFVKKKLKGDENV